MIAGLVLIGALGLALFMLTGARTVSLPRGEWFYLCCTPLPIVLTLVLPGPLSMLGHGTETARHASNLVSATGTWLSLALMVAGAWLVWARRNRGEVLDLRLAAGWFLASIPTLLVGLIALLYSVR